MSVHPDSGDRRDGQNWQEDVLSGAETEPAMRRCTYRSVELVWILAYKRRRAEELLEKMGCAKKGQVP